MPLTTRLDRQVYFDDDELELYQTQFAPYGVSTQHFFTLLHHGKWHVAEPGTLLVHRGDSLDSVMFIMSGAAHAYTEKNGERKLVYIYEGRYTAENAPNASAMDPNLKRGSIIGGTALMEPNLLGEPYPNTVEVTQRAKYLEWKTAELRTAMREDNAVEAAVFSTLYLDLVHGLRLQRQSQRQEQASRDAEEDARIMKAEAKRQHEEGRKYYNIMLRAVSDGEENASALRFAKRSMEVN